MGVDPAFWRGRRVFLTGHTGFKGGWLALWLGRMGAEVTGFSLDPPTTPSLYETARVGEALAADLRGDIVDRAAVEAAVAAARPEIVLHLAAQPLVTESYRLPIETYAANVMGTGHVVAAACARPETLAVVAITTDKCYENREWVHPYRETDRLGGHDPYSSSKACAEILVASLRASLGARARIATARAGNVIGGGDWAQARLIPDCVAAFCDGRPVVLRRPDAVRPWQHVLEPLAGYLMLAQRLATAPQAGADAGWNFGPEPGGEQPVRIVAQRLADIWGDGALVRADPAQSTLHEAGLLRLDSTKARLELGWRPAWSFDRAMTRTAEWYRDWRAGADMAAASRAQIAEHAEALRAGEAA